MAKLGFVGLGIMGEPMARHLLQAGQEVALWSYISGKADPLLQYGKGTVCSSPAEVASGSGCVFLCVGDTEMSRQVILGENGRIAAGRPGLVVVDCSTISLYVRGEIASKLKQHNIDFLDAPCTGSENGALGLVAAKASPGFRERFLNSFPRQVVGEGYGFDT